MDRRLAKHNQEAYEKIVEKFKTSNRTAVIHATGTGKTSIAIKWIEDFKEGKTLYLAPNTIILNQAKKYLENTQIDINSIDFVTYTELLEKIKREEHIKIDRIILDEFHRCGAPEWQKGIDKLLEENKEAKVLGLTATPRRYVDGRDMLRDIFKNNVASQLSVTDAMKMGIIKIPTYVNAIYSFKESIENIEQKIERLETRKEKNELQKQLNTIKQKIEEASGLENIIKKHLPKENGKYVVFCNDIKDMHKKMLEFSDMFPNSDISEVSYKKSNKNNTITLEEFESPNNEKMKLLFTVDKLNEGIHIQGVNGIFMLRSTKSPIIYMQQLGRALSISSDNPAVIYDLANNIYSSNFIYQLKDELSGKNKTKRNKNKDNDVEIGNFEIIDDLYEYVDLLKKIDEKLEMTSVSRTLNVLEALSEAGVDVSKIQISYKKNKKQIYTLLKDVKDDNIDKIIQENGLNPNFKIGINLNHLRKLYNKNNLAEKDKQKAEKLGVVKKEKISTIEKELQELEKVKKSGINLRGIQLSRREENKKIFTLLHELPDKDINEKIEKNKLEPNLPIGKIISKLRLLYNSTKKGMISEDDKKRIEKLGILERISQATETLDILEILKNNGIELKRIQLYKSVNGVQISTLLKEVENIDKIIEEHNLDPEWPIGYRMDSLKQMYNGKKEYKLSPSERKRTEKLEIVNLEKKTLVAKTLEVLDVLNEKGINLNTLKTRTYEMENGKKKPKFFLLKELNYPEMDKIIEENSLDPNFRIGYNIYVVRQAYNGHGTALITDGERLQAEKLGIIRNSLGKKEKKQKELKATRDEAKKLKDEANQALERKQKNGISK